MLIQAPRAVELCSLPYSLKHWGVGWILWSTGSEFLTRIFLAGLDPHYVGRVFAAFLIDHCGRRSCASGFAADPFERNEDVAQSGVGTNGVKPRFHRFGVQFAAIDILFDLFDFQFRGRRPLKRDRAGDLTRLNGWHGGKAADNS